ncbi:MAG TPA: hypothetical protein VHO25_17980 [Polyangiaceae bacterium]|nr:hypothetical protein [Polyangiaceae bacterium]
MGHFLDNWRLGSWLATCALLGGVSACDGAAVGPQQNPDAALCSRCLDAGGDSDSGSDGGSVEAGTDGGSHCEAELCAVPHLTQNPTFPDCIYTSPLLARSRGQDWLIVVPQHGAVTAVSPIDGHVEFAVALPSPDDRKPSTIATPVIVGSRLFVAYQIEESDGRRERHRVVAIDLEAQTLDPDFEMVELAATKPTWDGTGEVDFLADHALSRSTLAFGQTQASPEGFIYVSFGNARDIQPWHGWVFELDIEKWRTGGAEQSQSAVLLTSPEDHCPVEGQSGSTDMICGGGVWAPSGLLVIPNEAGSDFELIVPTGNGLLDLDERSYANSMLKTGPGLAFEPGCDPTACTDFDPVAPEVACMDSCSNLFMPRLMAGDPPLAPTSGVCDDRTFLECYARLDYDLGANTPGLVKLGNRQLFVLPAKDGAVYLFDAEHLGTLYDREVIVEQCGTPEDGCAAGWAGMMVTEPVLTEVDGEIRALIPTFMFDKTHPAGLVSLAVVETPQGPRLEPRWTAPRFDNEEAVKHFRRHPSRAALLAGGDYVAWVDVVKGSSAIGTLYVVRVTDGEIVLRVPLSSHGRRYIEPLVHDRVLWTTSCDDNDGPGILEAIRFNR